MAIAPKELKKLETLITNYFNELNQHLSDSFGSEKANQLISNIHYIDIDEYDVVEDLKILTLALDKKLSSIDENLNLSIVLNDEDFQYFIWENPNISSYDTKNTSPNNVVTETVYHHDFINIIFKFS